jgi:RHS repeat-associated protein
MSPPPSLNHLGLDGLGNWKTSNFTLVGSGGSTPIAEVRQHNYVNEITTIKDTGGTPTSTPYTYDACGNLLSDGVNLYNYDVFNRMQQVTSIATSNILVLYAFDGINRRAAQENFVDGSATGITFFAYDGQQIIGEVDQATFHWLKIYFWGQYVDELLFLTIVPTATTYRIMSDLLYRSTALVDTSNTIIEAYDTDAYGNTLCYSGPGTDGLWFTDDDVITATPINTTIFTGRQLDVESGLYYYRARYYSPQIGRFISRDPLENAELTQGPNLYWYIKDSPANGLDPRGLDCCNGVQYDPTSQCCNNGQVVPKPANCPCGQQSYPNWKILGFSSATDCVLTETGNVLGNTLTNISGVISGGLGGGGALAGGGIAGSAGTGIAAGGASVAATAGAGGGLAIVGGGVLSAIAFTLICNMSNCARIGAFGP